MMDWRECAKGRIVFLGAVGILFLFLLIFVSAEGPDAFISQEDYKTFQDITEKTPINPDTGEIDFEKYKPYTTKAEMRIAAINLWLEENASWLEIVFGMGPSFTWLFVVSLWVWLLMLVVLVLNADSTFSSIPGFGGKRWDSGFIEISFARLAGLILFLGFLYKKYTVWIAGILLELLYFIWNYVLPWGLGIAVVVAIFFSGSFVAFLVVVIRIFGWLKLRKKNREEKKSHGEQVINRKDLDVLSEKVTHMTRKINEKKTED